MAALSDHDRRDAEHAARTEIAILCSKYIRRMTDMTKAIIKEELDNAARDGVAVDGTAVGRAAAARAAAPYFGVGTTGPAEVVEGHASAELTA